MAAYLSTSNLLLGLRALQLMPNGLGGTMMILDPIHKQVSKDFVTKLRYPWWFATALGAWKLTQVALNWVFGGIYAPAAQAMMSIQLGGALFTHVVAEGKGWTPEAVGAPLLFFCTTVAITALSTSVQVPTILFCHFWLASVGYMAGNVVVMLGPGDSDALTSPVKWQEKRGFPATGEQSKKKS